MLADLSTLQKQSEPKGSIKPEAKERWEAIVWFKEKLKTGEKPDPNLFDDNQALVAKELCLLSAKPELFAVNVDEDKLCAASYAQELGVDPKSVVVVSAKIESELSALSEEDQKEYMKELGIEKSGLEWLAETAYATLGLQSFLTAGELEVKAWTIPKGTTAQQAAGVIHTDFIKKFIKANISSYEDFVALGGWKAVREAGKMRIEGKEYIMREGDIVEFMIGS